MITLNIFADWCTWWPLFYLLSFLLGLLLGWAIWAKWAKRAKELEDKVAQLNVDLNQKDNDLSACLKEKSQFKEALSISESRIRKLEEDSDSDSAQDVVTIDESLSFDGTDNGDDSEQESHEDSGNDEDNESRDTGTTSSFASNIAASSFATGGAVSSGPSIPDAGSDKWGKLQSNNLQIIEGIGPKMESVLHENGIESWSALASQSTDQLNGILGRYGDKYRIIDPEDWPAQAALARDRNWNGLIAHQKADGSESKAEKVFVKLGILKAWKQDDLKAIEGIGPKIEGLLHDAGITTWAGLADASVERLESILAAAGKRYQLADPGTWPRQAAMAAAGNWDALDAYQDELKGGRPS